MTNFEKIKAMDEDALADFLYSSASCILCPVKEGCTQQFAVCRGRLLNWLKQEVKDE